MSTLCQEDKRSNHIHSLKCMRGNCSESESTVALSTQHIYRWFIKSLCDNNELKRCFCFVFLKKSPLLLAMLCNKPPGSHFQSISSVSKLQFKRPFRGFLFLLFFVLFHTEIFPMSQHFVNNSSLNLDYIIMHSHKLIKIFLKPIHTRQPLLFVWAS